MSKEDTIARLNEDFQVTQVGDLSTVDGVLEYLGVKNRPLKEQREVVQAFITGARWADNVMALHITELQDRGILD